MPGFVNLPSPTDYISVFKTNTRGRWDLLNPIALSILCLFGIAFIFSAQLSDPQAGCLLEDLKCRSVTGDPKHLGDQLSIADPYELVQRNTREAVSLRQCPHDARQPASADHRGLTR